MFRSLIRLFLVASTTLLVSACGDNDSSSSTLDTTGSVSVSITDAPVDNATSVIVEITGIELKQAGQENEVFEFDPPRQIDLLALQGGITESLLDGETVSAGDYQWMRLSVNAERGVIDSFIDLDTGARHSLFIPSSSQNGLMLVSGFTVDENGASRFTIDFDLRKSVHAPPGRVGDYILRPALRLVEDEASGNITGTVDAALIVAPCSPAVYAYSGAGVTPDDVDGDSGDPIATGLVEMDAGTGEFNYTIAFLEAGDYTVAFTCEADLDEPDVDDVIAFQQPQDATVTEGSDTVIDF